MRNKTINEEDHQRTDACIRVHPVMYRGELEL